MKKKSNMKVENVDFYTKMRERAAILAESINEVKERGITVIPHEPIEGKMYWSE